MTTKVSVIVCTYNRCESLADTLRSLHALEVPDDVDAEFIIVDNNSSDATRQVVEQFAGSASRKVRYLFEGTQGLSHARNRGIAESIGEYLLFTDDDVLVEPSWLRHTLGALTDSDAACAGGKVLPRWLSAKPAWLSNQLLNVLAMLDYGEQRLELGRGGDDRILYGANMAFRRDALVNAGAFNVQLGRRGGFGAGEDKEIQDKLIAQGHKVVYEPKSAVLHKVDPQRLTKKYFRLWHYNAGRDRARLDRPSRFSVLGIESYLIREFVRTVPRWLGSVLLLRADRSFELELRCILYLSVFKHKIARSLSPASRAERDTNASVT